MKSRKSSFVLRRAALLTIVLTMALASATPCRAQSFSDFGSDVENYFINWFPRVTQIQSEQPHWITPLVTVTPRLEEEVRYDQFFESMRDGLATDNFGAGKGIELIPFQNTEVIVGIPGFQKRNKPRNTDGFGDWPFLVKYRLFSGNEENGNYIVTAFMGFSVPTGSNVNGNGHGIFTPTLAAGKGFGDFDVQSTVGVAFPSGGLDRLGMPLAWNTAFQYRLFKYFWPEFETNYTWQSYGADTGHSTLYLTPGMVIGRIPIHDRIGLTFGAGEQVAVTMHRGYNHNVILTARIPF
ncbi:MAG: hypothetical protein WBY93_04235 [Candidatus Binatus sp.]